jgi:hypothetical protein
MKGASRNPIEVLTQREGRADRKKLSGVNIKAVAILRDMGAPQFICPSSYPATFSLLEEGSPLGKSPTNL